MRNSIRILAAIALTAALSLPPAEVRAQDEGVLRLLVELNSDNDAISSREFRQAIRNIRKLSTQAPKSYDVYGQKTIAGDMRKWRIVEVDASQASQLVEDLKGSPAVKSVSVEQIYQQASTPNDPAYGLQYGLPLIGAPEAWNNTTGNSSTVIAIIDGGVDLSHEDLSDKIWQNSGEIAANNIDDDNNGFVDDVNGWDFVSDKPAGIAINHATHVAGIAAASGNNNTGVSGVDWQAKIMSVRALSQSGQGGEADIVQAIDYAANNGADVINLSIVGGASQALLTAIENAYAKGVVIVAAAGNNGADTGITNPYPACAETGGVNMVIGVAAIDADGEPTNFSAYGDCVDISAPGKDIHSTKVNDNYGEMTGTSMSAPFVAGAAGLYLSQHAQASPGEVISAITSSKKSFNGSEASQWNGDYKGMLDLSALITAPPADNDNDTSSASQAPSASNSSGDSGQSGGGGGSDGGGGGDGGGDGGEEPAPTPKPKVAGAVAKKANLSLLTPLNGIFQSVYGRLPNAGEKNYWAKRIKQGEKTTIAALRGAMLWQKARGLSPVLPLARVLGVSINDNNLIAKINSLHRQAYGRNPSSSEHAYWLLRVSSKDKTSEGALLGAMLFHRLAGISH